MSDHSFKAPHTLTVEHMGRSFIDCELSGQVFEGTLFSGAYFDNVDLRHTTFVGVNLNDALFINCNLQGASILYCHLEGTHFVGCILDDIRLIGSTLERTLIDDAQNLQTGRCASIRFLYALGYLYEVYFWPNLMRPQDAVDGPMTRPLILLHGMTGHALDFKPLVDRVQRPVYAINLLGHGMTGYLSLKSHALSLYEDQTEERTSPSYTEVVAQCISIIEQLMSLDGHRKFDLLGYSMGGRLALHIAHELQSLEMECVLNHVYTIGASLGIEDKEERKERADADRRWSDALWTTEELDHFLTQWNAQPLLKRVLERSPHEAKRLNQHRSEHSPRGLAIAFDALGQGQMPPLRAYLQDWTHTTTWISGSEDVKYKKIAEEAIELNEEVCRSIIIEGCGHAPHLESIDLFWQHTGSLLNSD